MLTLNALVAAQSVLIPMQCEYYALEGLSALVGTIEQIKASVNPSLEIEGMLRTMFDPRNNLANEVSGQLIAHFGDKVFRTIVPRNVRLAEAPVLRQAVLAARQATRAARWPTSRWPARCIRQGRRRGATTPTTVPAGGSRRRMAPTRSNEPSAMHRAHS